MLAIDKLGLLGSAVAVSWMTNDISVPVLGVPVTVVGMSVIGVLAAFAISEPTNTLKERFTLIFSFTFVGIVTAALAPHREGWQWVMEVRAPFAGAVSFASTIVLKPIVVRVLAAIRTYKLELKFLRAPKKDGE